MVSAAELFTCARPKGRAGRILQFPLVRLVVAALFIAPFLLVHNTIIADAIEPLEGSRLLVANTIDRIVSVVVILLLYALYLRIVERRGARELSRRGAAAELGKGMLIALGLVGVMVLVMALAGFYRIEETGPAGTLVNAFFLFGMGSFLQEFFFTILLLRLLEEWLGTWTAVVITAVAFGAAHTMNANTTVWTTVAIVLTQLLLAGAFVNTRRLWLVWGIHWGWNFFQDGVFGMPNSGITSLPSWIEARISGPAWLTGGAYGIEASVVSLILVLALAGVILIRAMGRGQVVAPSWRRRGRALGGPKFIPAPPRT